MGSCRRLRTSARTLAAFVAATGLAVPSCGHDWSAGPDAADAAGDAEGLAPDETPAGDVAEDEATPDAAGPDDAGADDAGPDDGPTDTPVDVPPDCLAPVGHDEDGDGVDDGCDNCPTYPNADQFDEDGDTLGDPCEQPLQHELFSRIAGFDAFASGSSAPGLDWAVWNGTWTRSDDAVTGASVPLGGNYWWTTPVAAPLAVETVFRLSDSGSGTPSIWGCVLLGLVVEGLDTPGFLTTCCFGYQNRELSIWHWRTGSSVLERIAAASDSVEPAEYPPDLWRRLRFTWDGRFLRCRIDTGEGLAQSSLVEHLPSPDLADELERGSTGIRVYNGTAEFRSFIVYR